VVARKTFPFLSIHGVKDRHMCVDKMEKFMHGNFKNVEFHRLDSAGHAPFYEQPSVVNKIILDFVNRISLQS
jgi:pimeloyl-ACP methyl ester carboxylesterase